ncbi:MAG: response regulator [Magnetococcales bacterium]|nr:response regulator [Magnetococcales bacterium]
MITQNILVVDDTADIRALLRMHLESWGFYVLEATNGESCLAAVALNTPDLILLDHHMPGMEGLDVLGRLRKAGIATPVVMLTADPTQTVAVRGFLAGADDFLSKPFDPDYLELVIRRTLRRREQSAKLRETEVALAAELLSAQLKDRLLINLNHETGTLIHQLGNYLEFMDDCLTQHNPSEAQRFLSKAHAVLGNLDRLFNRLSRLAKLESGSVEFRPVSTPFSRLVAGVLDRFVEPVAANQIDLICQDIFDVEMWVDVEWLHIALVELLDNAVRLTPKEGRIELKGAVNVDRVTLTITDSGPGIPGAELETIFFPFTESTRTSCNTGGIGLGLAIAKQVIVRHGGMIHAGHNPNGGAAMTVVLPVVAGI